MGVSTTLCFIVLCISVCTAVRVPNQNECKETMTKAESNKRMAELSSILGSSFFAILKDAVDASKGSNSSVVYIRGVPINLITFISGFFSGITKGKTMVTNTQFQMLMQQSEIEQADYISLLDFPEETSNYQNVAYNVDELYGRIINSGGSSDTILAFLIGQKGPQPRKGFLGDLFDFIVYILAGPESPDYQDDDATIESILSTMLNGFTEGILSGIKGRDDDLSPAGASVEYEVVSFNPTGYRMSRLLKYVLTLVTKFSLMINEQTEESEVVLFLGDAAACPMEGSQNAPVVYQVVDNIEDSLTEINLTAAVTEKLQMMLSQLQDVTGPLYRLLSSLPALPE